MTIKTLALKIGFAGALLIGGTAAALAAPAEATSAVNVRTGPGTSYRVIDQLYAGEDVDVHGCRGGWCEVSHSGPDGWVSANYLGRGGDYYDDDGYYDDGPDIIIRTPRPHYRTYYPRRHYYRDYGYYHRAPYANFCIGGNNASFCIGGHR
jgi:uncharacterized protein YraI